MNIKNLSACVVLDIKNVTVKLWKTRQPYRFFSPGWMQFGRLEIIVRKEE